jgi:hypothetical protein
MKNGLIAVTLFAVSLTNCAPVYIPSAPMVFNNQEEGDYQVAYRQGVRSSNLQVGYAVSDHINVGITGSAFYTQQVTGFFNSYDGTRGLNVDFVGGYYERSGDNVFEFTVGAGPILLQYPEETSDYFKLYIQPTYTINYNKKTHTDFSLIMRFTGTSVTALDENQELKNFQQGYLEPALSLSIGNKVKFPTQMGASLGLTQNYFTNNSGLVLPNNSGVILNFGLSYSLPKIKKETILP